MMEMYLLTDKQTDDMLQELTHKVIWRCIQNPNTNYVICPYERYWGSPAATATYLGQFISLLHNHHYRLYDEAVQLRHRQNIVNISSIKSVVVYLLCNAILLSYPQRIYWTVKCQMLISHY